MCYAHVHTNVFSHLKSVTTQNKSVADSILRDFENLQWSVLNEASFRKCFSLMEKKYLGQYDDILNGVLANFFLYMRKVWIDSTEFRWYEGSHPWLISNNQGIEGKNMAIKQSYTFRRKLELGELVSVLHNLVKDWSEEDDTILESCRLARLHGDKNSLALRTAGYQWYMMNNVGQDKIIRINPKGKYTVSESSEFNLGKVSNLWAVNSSEGLKSGLSLKERAKERLAHRELPLSSSFDDYLRIRSSCWILEEREGDFYCDCPVGMKVWYMVLKITFLIQYFRANFARQLLVCCTSLVIWKWTPMYVQYLLERSAKEEGQRRSQTALLDHLSRILLLLKQEMIFLLLFRKQLEKGKGMKLLMLLVFLMFLRVLLLLKILRFLLTLMIQRFSLIMLTISSHQCLL